jgi:hypothetical protein
MKALQFMSFGGPDIFDHVDVLTPRRECECGAAHSPCLRVGSNDIPPSYPLSLGGTRLRPSGGLA